MSHVERRLDIHTHRSGSEDRGCQRRDRKGGVNAKALLHALRQVGIEHAHHDLNIRVDFSCIQGDIQVGQFIVRAGNDGIRMLDPGFYQIL